MIRSITIIILLFLSFSIYGQCDIDFGSTAAEFTFSTIDGTDIVNGDAGATNATDTQGFNIWDEAATPLNCSAAGTSNDISFDFEILPTFDVYSVDGIIDDYAGHKHEITQSTTGLKGRIPMGDTNASDATTGDVRGYKITVDFASYVSINASDVTVELSSVNTAGKIFESCSVIFLDETDTPYGTSTYHGFYGSGGASIDGTCTAPAATVNPWTTTGKGFFIAADTATVKLDPLNTCNAIGGTNGSDNNKNVEAVADAGLDPTDKIGGFVFIIYAEDIAPSLASGAETSTKTIFSSTLKGVAISSVVLPVEMTSFDARQVNDDVSLNWTTASETNNDYFEVQHSLDGTNFSAIGKKEGSGNSTIIQQYNYIHPDAPQGKNYYRLKQVDLDGKFEYSEIVFVDISRISKVSIQPTLASTELQIILPEDHKNTSYKIFNATGQIIQEGNLIDFLTQQNIALDALHSGSYFIQIGNKVSNEIFRFVKIN